MATSKVSREVQTALESMFVSIAEFNAKHFALLRKNPELATDIQQLKKKKYVGFIPISGVPVKKLDVTVTQHLVVLHSERGSQLALCKYVGGGHEHYTSAGMVIVTPENFSECLAHTIGAGEQVSMNSRDLKRELSFKNAALQKQVRHLSQRFQDTTKKISCPDSYKAVLDEVVQARN